MSSDLEKLKQGILNHGVFFGEVQSYIWDMREVLLLEDYCLTAAKLLWPKLKKYQPEVLYGDGYGCAPLIFNLQSVAAQDGYKISVLWLRKRKNRNRKRLIEGPRPRPNARAIYVDDLFSYGDTWAKTPPKLKEEKIEIQTVAVACILDLWRNGGSGGTRRTYAKGYPIESLLTRHDLGFTRIDGTKLAVKKTKWRLITKNLGNPAGVQTRLKSPPTIYNNKVFHCTDQGDLYCLDLESGNIHWKYQPVVPHHNEKEVINEFQIFEDKLYYASYDGSCRCIDINDGSIVWQRLTATYQHSTPAIDIVNRRLYLNAELWTTTVDSNNIRRNANNSSDISCYNLDTGDLIWRSDPVNATGPGSVTIVNETMIVVGSNNHSLRCYNSKNGTLLWTVAFPGDIKGRSVVFNDKIYAVDELGWFKIIDLAGNIIKTQRVGKTSRHQFLTHVPGLDYVIVTAEQYIHAFNEFGQRMWMTQTRGVVETRGSLNGNFYLTVTKNNSYIQVIDVRDGSKVQQFHSGIGPCLAPPCWDGINLAVHAQNRGLYLFETNVIKDKKVNNLIPVIEEKTNDEIHY